MRLYNGDLRGWRSISHLGFALALVHRCDSQYIDLEIKMRRTFCPAGGAGISTHFDPLIHTVLVEDMSTTE